jgi:hypothetical protein
MRSALAALAVIACANAEVQAPQPPCAAPYGIIPAVAESMCSTVVVPGNAEGVAVRSYGVPASEVLVTDFTPSNFAYGEVLSISVSNIFYYLELANSANRSFLEDRTVPITVRPPGADGWLVSMMVSTAAFPDPAKVPTPNNFEMHLESVGARLVAAFAFNTTALPSEAEFKAACEKARTGKPAQYTVVEGLWTPTYVLYSPQNATLWTSECWIEVKPSENE